MNEPLPKAARPHPALPLGVGGGESVGTRTGHGDADDLTLSPPSGLSREEREQRSALPRSLPEPDPPARRPQFSVADVMVLMVGVAAGLAGGSWMPSDLFAAIVGLATLVGLLVVSWNPPQSHAGKLIWATLVLAYIVAVFAAVFRPITHAAS